MNHAKFSLLLSIMQSELQINT